MSRLTDNDKHIGPITIGRSGWNPWRLVFSTGGGDDEDRRNSLTFYAFGWVARVWLPTKLAPWKQWVPTGHYAWAKSPDAGYWDTHSREYGFCLHEGHLQVFLGPQTHDSVTTRSWSCFLPWTQWRHIRRSMFDNNGKHFWTEWSRPRGFKFRDQWAAEQAVKDACPSVAFEVEDHDGEHIVATTRIEEREWRFGEKWCRWLSIFRRAKVRRSLDIEFSRETGTEKGSWKGGLIGTSIEMRPEELHEAAFRRYCDQEHYGKHGNYRIKFVRRVPTQEGGAA